MYDFTVSCCVAVGSGAGGIGAGNGRNSARKGPWLGLRLDRGRVVRPMIVGLKIDPRGKLGKIPKCSLQRRYRLLSVAVRYMFFFVYLILGIASCQVLRYHADTVQERAET